LTYRLGHINYVVTIDGKSPGILRQGKWSATEYIRSGVVLLFNIEDEGRSEKTQAAAAGKLNLGVQFALGQYATVGTYQPDLTPDPDAIRHLSSLIHIEASC
jgi:hypothetical protein